MDNIAFARHLSDRLGFGPRPGDLDAIARQGGDRWIESQLQPQTLPLPRALSDRIGALSNLHLSPFEAFRMYAPQLVRAAQGAVKDPDAIKEALERARVVPAEAIEARILRAVYSPRQLEEALVEFWFNHFNVFVAKGLDRVWIASYEESAIRPHVLGRFRDLLGATAHHPAMQFYLDNWQNTSPDSTGARGRFKGLNENYARELMELHTLGVDGGYTQDDVIALAKIFTGWGFGGRGGDGADGMARDQLPLRQRLRIARKMREAGGFIFAEERHDFSDKRFLGHVIKGGGEAEGETALDILARHPATARHISFKLAQYFLADAPDPQIVQHMAEVFQKSDGDIRAVLRTLFASAQFRDPANFGTKFKTPYRYVLSAVRASDASVRNFRPLFGTLTQLGQPPYACLTPDGYKCTQDAWLNADAMTRRISFAVALAGGHLPLNTPPDDRGLGAKRPERAAERAMAPIDRAASDGAAPPSPPVNADKILAALGGQLSDTTHAAVEAAPAQLRAALILGSPEFMRC